MLLFEDIEDFSDKKALIGLSGGINSAAVLVWVCNLPDDCKPKELHLFYSHFREHSPDTLQFCLDLWSYAKERCPNVIYKQIDNSILSFFRDQKMIPHPMVSPKKTLSLLRSITPNMPQRHNAWPTTSTPIGAGKRGKLSDALIVNLISHAWLHNTIS